MDLQVGINISPLQIENSDFVNRIRQKIHDEDIKPEWIDIEITEGVAMSSQVSMEEIFSGLANRCRRTKSTRNIKSARMR